MPSGHRNEQYVRPDSNVSRRTTRKPAAAKDSRFSNLIKEGMNCRYTNMLAYLVGINDLKSTKRRKKHINIRVEKTIRKLLRKGDLIRNYILILLIFRESRFILPSPILWAIGIYSIFSMGTLSILAAAASPATQSAVKI